MKLNCAIGSSEKNHFLYIQEFGIDFFFESLASLEAYKEILQHLFEIHCYKKIEILAFESASSDELRYYAKIHHQDKVTRSTHHTKYDLLDFLSLKILGDENFAYDLKLYDWDIK